MRRIGRVVGVLVDRLDLVAGTDREQHPRWQSTTATRSRTGCASIVTALLPVPMVTGNAAGRRCWRSTAAGRATGLPRRPRGVRSSNSRPWPAAPRPPRRTPAPPPTNSSSCFILRSTAGGRSALAKASRREAGAGLIEPPFLRGQVSSTQAGVRARPCASGAVPLRDSAGFSPVFAADAPSHTNRETGRTITRRGGGTAPVEVPGEPEPPARRRTADGPSRQPAGQRAAAGRCPDGRRCHHQHAGRGGARPTRSPSWPAPTRAPAALAAEIAEAHRTGRPFGVNLFVPNPSAISETDYRRYARAVQAEADRYGLDLSGPAPPAPDDDRWQDKLDLLLAEPVPVVSLTFGLPQARRTQRPAPGRQPAAGDGHHDRGGPRGRRRRCRRARRAGQRRGRAPRQATTRCAAIVPDAHR